MKYDCIIIGGGMSALAAGIRLAHYDKKVCICERHTRLGGLNSYFKRHGTVIETGLHAMTNFTTKKASRALPLQKILRQLRIPYDTLMLREQKHSLITFPGVKLKLTNDFSDLEQSIAENFPGDIDDFRRLNSLILEYDALNLNSPYVSARAVLKKYLKNSLLVEMILCPLMYYGSAVENDMDFSQFVIMYKSIFHEGFCRPAGEGIISLLELLKQRYLECGGELLMAHGVRKIKSTAGEITAVELDNGTILETCTILSTIGYPETISICDDQSVDATEIQKGELAFVELVAGVNHEYIQDLDFSINFFNQTENFSYQKPASIINRDSGVICLPTNFQFTGEDIKPAAMIRITALSNHGCWPERDVPLYLELKQQISEALLKNAEKQLSLNNIQQHALFIDVMTPRTITRFTGRFNGAIYGSPQKIKNGTTLLDKLFICGTDQGFLGIIGAMLSGISIANLHLMQ